MSACSGTPGIFQHNTPLFNFMFFFCLACGVSLWRYHLCTALYLAADSRGCLGFGHCFVYLSSFFLVTVLGTFFFPVVLGMEVGVLCIPEELSSTEVYPQAVAWKF